MVKRRADFVLRRSEAGGWVTLVLSHRRSCSVHTVRGCGERVAWARLRYVVASLFPSDVVEWIDGCQHSSREGRRIAYAVFKRGSHGNLSA